VSDLLILGQGYTGSVVARLAHERGLHTVGTVRNPDHAGRGILVAPSPSVLAGYVTAATHVIVCFPPDGTTDAALAPLFGDAKAITYLSTTGVYGDRRGVIDDTTPIAAAPSPRRAAEEIWHAVGATILRCPAIYGPDRGIHVRMRAGDYRIAGDGSQFTSRIHVVDLARLILAAGDVRGETFVVGDQAPATQNEICRWIADEYGIPFPPYVPLEQVHPTLRADRQVDGARALEVLGVTLAYPRYSDGMAKTN